MARRPAPYREEFLDYLFEQMTADQRRAFETRARADEHLAALVTAGRAVLAPLDDLTPPATPPDFVDSVMAEIEATVPLGVHGNGPDDERPSAGEWAPRPRGILSLGEFIAIAASIALIITFSVPGMASLRARQLQTRCGANLASLAGGLTAYANIFDGAMPAVVTSPGSNWLRLRNIRHMQPALREGLVQPSQLTCPTGRSAPDQVQDPSAFLERARVTFYSAQNANGPVVRLQARFLIPLAGDPNPMFQDGQILDGPTDVLNSNAHDGRGQNVALPDGSVEFLTTPIFDERDNIWQAENVERYTGTETQLSATDAFLIP